MLLGTEGDVVTVVGQVIEVYSGRAINGSPYVKLNFGAYGSGEFALALWSDTLDLFHRLGKDVSAYHGQWVSVTGCVGVFRPRSHHKNQNEQPQITITMPTEIQVLTEAQARMALSYRSAPPPARPILLPNPPTVRPPIRSAATLDTGREVTILNKRYMNRIAAPYSSPALPPQARRLPPQTVQPPASSLPAIDQPGPVANKAPQPLPILSRSPVAGLLNRITSIFR